MVFFMESNQQAGFVLILQFPQVTQNPLETLLITVGIHKVKQVLDACCGIHHVNDCNALCASVNVTVDSPVMPLVKGGKLACIRALCVNQHGIVKRALIIPCHTRQQTFPLHRVFRVFLHRLII